MKKTGVYMIIGRFLGYLSLCLMIMVFGAEGLRFLEGGSEGLLSLFDVLEFALNKEIESEEMEGHWTFYLSPFLSFSAFFSLLITGLVLTFLFRKRI